MTKYGAKKVGISVSLEPELLKELDDFCEENYNAERSSVITKALKKFFLEVKK